MSAECYWCKTKSAPGKVASPVGTRGEALGCCLKCQVLVCGDHGARDNSRQEFRCWDCLFIKLVASAVQQANLGSDDQTALRTWDKIFEIVFRNIDDIFSSYEEFKTGHAQLRKWFGEVEQHQDTQITSALWPFPVENTFTKFSGDAERFLMMAAHLISSVESANRITEFDHVFKYYLLQIIHNTMLR